jgi:hypothetical protein
MLSVLLGRKGEFYIDAFKIACKVLRHLIYKVTRTPVCERMV